MSAVGSRGIQPWMVSVGCMIGLTVAAPAYQYGFAIYLKPIAAETGWSRSAIILGLAISSLVAAVLTPVIGVLIDRIGSRRVSLIGCIGLPVAIAALGLQRSYPQYLIVAAGGGIFCAFASATAYLSILPQWFERNLGKAIALAATGIGLSSAVVPIAANYLVERYGWRSAIMGMGLGLLLIGLATNLFLVRENPEFVAARRRNPRGVDVAYLDGVAFSDAIRTIDFWKLSIAFLLIVTVVSACYLNLGAIATDRGFTLADAAIALSVYGAGGILAKIATGIMIDRMPVGIPATLFLSAPAFAILILWTGWPVANLTIAAGLLGVASGCEGDLIPYMVKRRFGMRAYGRLYGLMFGVFQLGPIVGPLALGIVYDRYRSYDPAFPVFLALSILALILVMSARITWAYPGVKT